MLCSCSNCQPPNFQIPQSCQFSNGYEYFAQYDYCAPQQIEPYGTGCTRFGCACRMPREFNLERSEVPAVFSSNPMPLYRIPTTMTNFKMADQSAGQEYAELQKASEHYEPEIIGRLVEEVEPSSAITEEYAKADPVFIAKTTSLEEKYHSYRKCRGDGNCGWRAIAFGYFESLITLDNTEKYYEEISRLNSLNNLLNLVGFEGIHEDFSIETTQLLQQISRAECGQDARQILMTAFNDDERSGYIIYHFRLLASAFMRTNQDDFMPYLDVPVETYCKSQIEINSVELDQPGISALIGALIKDAGLGLEIIYLDRSPGSVANVISHCPPHVHIQGIEAFDFPTITLLYRPGHYDIIYKRQEIFVGAVRDIRSKLDNQIFPLSTANYLFDLEDLITRSPVQYTGVSTSSVSPGSSFSEPNTPGPDLQHFNINLSYSSTLQPFFTLPASMPDVTKTGPCSLNPAPSGFNLTPQPASPQLRNPQPRKSHIPSLCPSSPPISKPFLDGPYNRINYMNANFEPQNFTAANFVNGILVEKTNHKHQNNQ